MSQPMFEVLAFMPNKKNGCQ